MTSKVRSAAGQQMGVDLRHEALLWDGIDEFLAGTVPFVQDGLAADEPVLVALIESRWEPLRAALGREADRVHRLDMADVGRNPARMMSAWLDFVASRGLSGRMTRGVGEVIWPGRTGPEIAECQIHEAALNAPIIDTRVPMTVPIWALCAYDVGSLAEDVVQEALRTHPTVVDDAGRRASPDFAGDGHLRVLRERELPAPAVAPDELAFGLGTVGAVRDLVT